LLPWRFVAPRPAQAQSGWGSVLPGACDQGICASKEAVCEFWGNFYGHWPGDLTPIYNNGRIVAWHCTAVYWFNNSNIDIYPTPYCSAGFSNASTGSGCSLLLPPNAKLLGVPVCNKCVGVVGNPINRVIGNKFEIVTDYASAGPQKLAFIRA
jgi:hypothetical protein